jgi:hypothetical protein
VTVAAYIPNLMDRSRVAAAAEALGLAVEFAPTAADLDRSADLILVDLGRPGIIDALAAAPPDKTGRSIGFASHVDRDLLRRGREVGCDQVLARSAFFGRLPAILAAASPTSDG